jgi:hypothetical protein
MVKSQITEAIDQVVSAGIRPVLKERGFKKQGRTFQKRVGDLYHVVHVQASRRNEFDSGQFTVNLGIASPEIATAWLGGRVPKNPASHRNMLLHERIGFLLPMKKDRWWTIGPDTDLGELAREVSDSLTRHALKFFEIPAFQTTQALLEALERRELQMSLFGAPTIQEELRAVLLHRAGRVDEAETVLTNLLAGKEHKMGLEGYVSRIRDLGARLGFAM